MLSRLGAFRFSSLTRFLSSHAVVNNSCWSCGKKNDELVSNLFCVHCRALQKPNKQKNYFELLGQPEKYEIDEINLAKKYKDLQKYLHPDRFSTKPRSEQEISEEYSSLVNQAYNTLLQPLSRGIYMLQLKGRIIPENTQLDQEFLVEIMEKNEEVESASTDEEILELNRENRKVLDDLRKQLSESFFAGDLDAVTLILSRMKYYTSIDTQIQALIRSKGIIR